MSCYKPYPTYKNSGVAWIGDIPENWVEKKINHFTQVVSRKNFPDEELLSVYRDYGVIIKSSRDDNNNKAGEDLSSYKLVKPGNLVLNKMKTWQGSLGVSDFRGIVSPAYITCEIKKNVFENRYLHYLLRSEKYIYQYNRLSYGVRTDQWDMRYDDFKNTPVFIPPKQEQTAIAQFLDRKTAEIKAFIALKEKTIALLKERKTAIINQAVTKGLDANVEMKDSGIEWLGVIPKHWEVVRIGHYVNVFRGASPRPAGDPSLFAGDYMPWITVKEVTKRGEKYLTETDTYLTKSGARQSRLVHPETLMLSNSGATLGVPKISLIKGCFNDGSVAFKAFSNKLDRDFLYHFFNSHTEIYRNEMAGYGQPNLNTDIVKSTKLALPPLDEQFAISQFIDNKNVEFDEIIAQQVNEITLIKEYQQSLISEAVTGKIDVRSWQSAAKARPEREEDALLMSSEAENNDNQKS